MRRAARLLLGRADFGPWYDAECRIALAPGALRLERRRAGARAAGGGGRGQLERSPDAKVPRPLDRGRPGAGGATPSAAPGGGWWLTTAELRVLQFLPTHLSFPEMAERLFVSANTVKTHARSVYRKLGASSRGEAVVRAREAGLLDQASHAGVGSAGLAGIS